MKQTYDFHPLANIFPIADGPELDALAEDIKIVGLIDPIILYEGKILDGRRRYLACKKANHTPKFLGLANDVSPLDYVVSANIHRRHLNPSQLAVVGLRLLPLYEEQAKERQRLSRGRGKKGAQKCVSLTGKATEHVANLLGCSGRMIEMAKRVQTEQSDLIDQIIRGSMRLSEAYDRVADRRADVDDELRTTRAAGRRVKRRKKRSAIQVATIPAGFRSRVDLISGDALSVLRKLPSESVDCCVTSPPYFQQRDYGDIGQIGLESTVNDYVRKLNEVFVEVRRVLCPVGVVWINISDTYVSAARESRRTTARLRMARNTLAKQTSHKSLCGVPARLICSLLDSGWLLRSDVIWHKTNAFPESVLDRPGRTHETIFMLVKQNEYFFDPNALRIPYADSTVKQGHSKTTGANPKLLELHPSGRLRGSVWKVAAGTGAGEHPAPMPLKLAVDCVLAGCQEGGTVLDPFVGSGTTAVACVENRRHCIGIDISEKYLRIAQKRVPGAKVVQRMTG